MRKYEILYIIENSLSDEDKEKVIANVRSLVEKNGGTCSEPEKWGTRKYAYPIDYKNEGFYVLMNYEAEDSVPAAVAAKLNINKNVVRHMTIAK